MSDFVFSLQDNVPFDIGRLFKWQETNTLSPGYDEADISKRCFIGLSIINIRHK